MKKLIIVMSMALFLTVESKAQTTDPSTNSSATSTVWDSIKNSGLLTATNYSFEPYGTYAPNAPKGSKIGGGLFAAYNFNSYVGAGLGLDYLGQFSIVSGNVQLKYPTKPLGFMGGMFTNVTVTPFVLAGVGKSLSGSSGSSIIITDTGAYIGFGHLFGGQFNVGAAWGRWDNAGIYSGQRYHAFAGWNKGF